MAERKSLWNVIIVHIKRVQRKAVLNQSPYLVTFLPKISKNPAIAIKIIEELSKRLQSAENLIESLGLQDVEQRVADALLRFSEGKNEILLSISKKDLASHIGISQETLSRKLSFFQDLGLIKQTGHRKILILDRESLAEIQ